jgi:3-deoxy-7-phosphoheptulonate synthase
MDIRHLEIVVENADMLQVGSRNMQNFSLLKELGMAKRPVLLKRGMAATIEEFLNAAEYIVSGGNSQVVLCERGIRTFEVSTRNTLDLNAVPILKKRSHLPVIVDPSHGTGHWWMVPALSRGAIAVGADGLIVEVHYDPAAALCDGAQSLCPTKFQEMMAEIECVAHSVGRFVSAPSFHPRSVMPAPSHE